MNNTRSAAYQSQRKRRAVRLVACAATIALVSAACGSDDDAAGSGSAEPGDANTEDSTSGTTAASGNPEGDLCEDPNITVLDQGNRTVQGIDIPGCIGTAADMQPMETFCGTEPMTIGYVDSWASVNSWRPITRAELTEEANKCDNLEEILFTDGQGELEKTISDIDGLVAQGVDLLVVMSDFGNQTLPAMRKAMDAGIPVVAINFSDPEGEPGVDFTDVVNAADEFDGQVRTQWLIDNRPGDTCNILHVGGSPGNPLSSAVYKGVVAGVAANEGCVLLNDGEPLTSNWNPADEQQAVAGALVQFDQIDGVMNECGTCAPGGWQAFIQAGRPLVPWASDDVNELACQFDGLKAENPDFEHLTFSARTWLSRLALHKAVAAFQGIPNTEPNLMHLETFQDSTDPDNPPTCVEDAPPTAIFSSMLSQEDVIATVS